MKRRRPRYVVMQWWHDRWLVMLRNMVWDSLHGIATRRSTPPGWEVAVFDRRKRARRKIRHWPRGMGHHVVRID